MRRGTLALGALTAGVLVACSSPSAPSIEASAETSVAGVNGLGGGQVVPVGDGGLQTTTTDSVGRGVNGLGGG